jgi:signal transduction histidine kinase
VKKGGLGLDRQLGRIDRNILRCNTIITKMLDYTRTRALEAAPRGFDAWLSEILDEYGTPPGIALRRELGAPGVEVEFDPGRLQQVFVNLLDNARDAITEAHGEAQPGADSADSITVRTAVAAGRLEIQVRDTGGGVPEEVLPKIFEPLFSTKGFGVGLGLPTVKQIVEQHGGTIAISSEAGKGATVKVSLSLTQTQEIAA